MRLAAVVTIIVMTGLAGCAPSGSTTEEGEKPAATPGTKEALYEQGHRLYVDGKRDSAASYLERARGMDPAYVPPLMELGDIYSVSAMAQGAGSPERESRMRKALGCYADIESLGKADENTLDRLTEISHSLGETESFVAYAEKHAVQYPGDRQSYNLGLAYFGAGAWQKVIDTQKQAISKYPHSPYVGGFYRLLGDGYLNVDRQQSAERTYEEGVQVVDTRIAGMTKTDPDFGFSPEFRRLADSRKAMLLSLQKIYRLHKKQDKLSQVESRLKEDP